MLHRDVKVLVIRTHIAWERLQCTTLRKTVLNFNVYANSESEENAWFSSKRSEDAAISGFILIEKVKELYEKMKLTRFRDTRGIINRNLQM
ncbi:hypothetical protein PR048_023013 [Dryococelus australis]|uniref:Protein kinase domain-containing protein n=1 Tax=Dryococelus australis TaxID=614101 RepID=A0ABQ9GSW1_9NEOP|nr:hypothetical protein PR048_023013 [Dryococelus australis]